jgi:hypothetical protein
MKPFFYRLNPAELLAELIRIPADQRGEWIVSLAVELISGNANTDYGMKLVEEAKEYSATKKEAARKRWDKKKTDDAPAMQVDASALQVDASAMHMSAAPMPVTVAVAVQKTIKEKEKEKKPVPVKREYAEAVMLTTEQYDTLVSRYGLLYANACIDKLSSAKMASSKLKYDSDYHAILKWVVERVGEKLTPKPAQTEAKKKVFTAADFTPTSIGDLA